MCICIYVYSLSKCTVSSLVCAQVVIVIDLLIFKPRAVIVIDSAQGKCIRIPAFYFDECIAQAKAGVVRG